MSSNPFEAPASAFDARGLAPPEAAPLQWRRGRVLFHPAGADFADRCVQCNAPTHGPRLKRRLYWHTPWLYLLVVQLLIYVIVAMIVRKSVLVNIALCDAHRARRRKLMLAGMLTALAGVGSCGAGVGGPTVGPLVPLGLLMVLVGLVLAIVGERVITPRRIDKTVAEINGVCDAYLAELPSR